MAEQKIYPTTIPALKKMILRKHPNAKPDGDESKLNNPGYWLWMLDQIPTKKNPAVRGRWIGWVMSALQIFGILPLQQARDLIREDAWMGYN